MGKKPQTIMPKNKTPLSMRTRVVGFSEGYHDSSLAIIEDDKIIFASQSERYSKIKNDRRLHQQLINMVDTDQIAFYEKPFLKMTRQLFAGQGWKPRSLSLKPKYYFGHHLTHASTAFQTSPFEHATVIVVDSIGEWDTVSIWDADYHKGKARYKKIYSEKYPYSLGLFYSSATKRVGLKPNEEEYILMGMASYGKYDQKVWTELDKRIHVNNHRGFGSDFLVNSTDEDIAYNAQSILEESLNHVFHRANQLGKSKNICYGGGVALNCVANAKLRHWADQMWIPPHPGDGGSAIGAALLINGHHVEFDSAYLGYNIQGKYPVEQALQYLLKGDMIGIANGKAEFGPRALGNRSLLCDPRGNHVKDMINDVKRRQKFRPFAPVILEEYSSQWFELNEPSPYMQYVVKCKRPYEVPAVCHVDNTSRVQTVGKDGSGIRQLLERWYQETKCPILLNTSLNIKGQPIVNTEADAREFSQEYDIPVLSS